jgi:predicted RNase H-like HicB family nuclease
MADERTEVEQETDGRYIAEDTSIPGVMAYGATEKEAVEKVQQLAVEVTAEPAD